MEQQCKLVKHEENGDCLFERLGVHFWLSRADRAYVRAIDEPLPGGTPLKVFVQEQEIERLKRIEKAWMFIQNCEMAAPLREALRLTFERDYIERASDSASERP